MVARGVSVGNWMKKNKGIEKYGSAVTKQSQGVKYSRASVISSTAVTLCGARWGLEILGGPLCKVYGCPTTVPYT